MSVFFALVLLASEPAPDRRASGASEELQAREAEGRPSDRAAVIAEVERVSLTGGKDSLIAILDFLARHRGDKALERHGIAALRRVSVPSLEVAEVVAGDPDPARRAWAAWLAGEQRLVPAADALIVALKDPDAKVRMRAAVSLGLLGDPRASDPLLRTAVHDKDASVRDAAEKSHAALAAFRMDTSPIEPVLAKLELDDEFERLGAVRELEKRKDRRAVGPLLELLKSERDIGVRKAAVTALAAIGDPLAVPALIEAAQKDAPEIRLFAIGALATLDDERAQPAILALVKDPDERVRRYAVRAVAFQAQPGAGSVLANALSDMVPDVRAEAAKGLMKVGARDLADPIAERVAVEPASGVRILLIGLLGDVGSAKHERVLIDALDAENPEVRLVAAAALGKIGGPASEKALRKLAEKEKKKREQDRDTELIRVALESAAAARGRVR